MANSTISGVRSLGAADTSVRATSAAAKLFLRVSLGPAKKLVVNKVPKHRIPRYRFEYASRTILKLLLHRLHEFIWHMDRQYHSSPLRHNLLSPSR